MESLISPTRQLPSSTLSLPCLASSTPTLPLQWQGQLDPNPGKKKKKKKKRSKTISTTIKVDDPGGTGSKPRLAIGNPNPNAPKITRPCTECGKRFWSWKAMFGHMRCHPERQWRGINPPLNICSSPLRQPGLVETEPFPCVRAVVAVMTEEDYEVAECLLKLADFPVITVNGRTAVVGRTTEDWCTGLSMCQKFECSSCKKVFGTHQALGGHRSSHKNVKGCFAMTRGGDGRDEEAFFGSFSMEESSEGPATTTVTGNGLEKSQWEKGDEEEEEGHYFCLDLNRPAPTTADEEDSTLDLRLYLNRFVSAGHWESHRNFLAYCFSGEKKYFKIDKMWNWVLK